MAMAAQGLMKVKDEPGEAKPAASHAMAMMPWNSQAGTNTTTMAPITSNDRPLTAAQPLASAGGGAGGSPMPSHPMFGAFPAGFFNAAAFAAAAAAAFPGIAVTSNNANNNSSNSGSNQSTTPKSKPNLLGPATPSNKRRKRGRGQEEDSHQQQHDNKGDTPAAAAAAAAVSPSGPPQAGPLLAKLEALSPDRPTPPPPQADAGHLLCDTKGGAGGGWSPGVVAPMNVLTPNLFEGDMSNQERKVGVEASRHRVIPHYCCIHICTIIVCIWLVLTVFREIYRSMIMILISTIHRCSCGPVLLLYYCATTTVLCACVWTPLLLPVDVVYR